MIYYELGLDDIKCLLKIVQTDKQTDYFINLFRRFRQVNIVSGNRMSYTEI